MNSPLSMSLSTATVQEIQLELIRRSSFNAFDGERVVESLKKHRHLWTAVLMDRQGLPRRAGGLATAGLIKLRDLDNNLWNVDTLFVLTPSTECAHELAQLVKSEDWGGEEPQIYTGKEVESALGGSERGTAIVTIWWD